ncbi:hypothetical protein SSEA_SKINNY_63 [Mycobacterium phage Skinny]|uniref:Uncharacterized protein n=6 Tax=Bongovirus bongo TaxID=1983750 RepID=A0A0M4S412_9CAUD|nr:hypothetical protein PEGLEG_61 [Mycobacterium phage PegLeg]YP_009604919.1 hypothetical protein FDH95_gp061 [Mycobacterium phage Bongo]ALF00589.1 hypothetical protein SEA_BRICOLE_61 [Mycobacterium phage Bricole]AXQ52702.1 hypothetical protein SEA_IPHANE7_61 [Mycobacterium phage IPhane7]QDH93634.1 hypothetical protein SEA_LILHOMIEP_60 [Mycobacterium phage LilhomieP]QGJ93208.1 hypothetical protein SEA_TYDAWG_61 [Mycobacterium phage TyDawg]QUU29261.1 hypothetical protein [Mycobacterium phage S
MAYPSNSPSIPAKVAELVYAALGHTLNQIDQHGTIPMDMRRNMRKVLQAYDRDRTAALNRRGVPTAVVQEYKAAAAAKLAEWLAKQADKVEVDESDFEQWAKELSGGDIDS